MRKRTLTIISGIVAGVMLAGLCTAMAGGILSLVVALSSSEYGLLSKIAAGLIAVLGVAYGVIEAIKDEAGSDED